MDALGAKQEIRQQGRKQARMADCSRNMVGASPNMISSQAKEMAASIRLNHSTFSQANNWILHRHNGNRSSSSKSYGPFTWWSILKWQDKDSQVKSRVPKHVVVWWYQPSHYVNALLRDYMTTTIIFMYKLMFMFLCSIIVYMCQSMYIYRVVTSYRHVCLSLYKRQWIY